MSFFDAILFILIVYFAISGYKSGFIRTVGGFIGLLIGVFFASRYYDDLASAWIWLFFGSETLAKVVLFVVLFLLVNRLVKLVVYLIDRFYKLLRFIPFTKFINKLAGLIVGLLEGSLIVGLIIYIIVRFPFSDGLLNAIVASEFAQQLLRFANILAPLIPEALEGAKVLI